MLGRKVQFNKSTAKKTSIYEIFELVKKIFSQFNKSTGKWQTPTFWTFSQESPIQQVNGQKTPIYQIFELLKYIFSQLNKSTSKWHTHTFGNFSQESPNFTLDSPIQQVNGRKNTYIWNFWVRERDFSEFNKSDRPIQQVNKWKIPLYEIFGLVK